MKRWYDLRAQTVGAEIVIYDEIGAFGIPAKVFLDELKALGAPEGDEEQVEAIVAALEDGSERVAEDPSAAFEDEPLKEAGELADEYGFTDLDGRLPKGPMRERPAGVPDSQPG